MSALSNYFAWVLKAYHLDGTFAREHKFHPDRMWRFDFADPVNKVAVEIDGGVFVAGRHSRGAGYRADCEKFNAAAVLGWRVFRYVERRGMGQFAEDYQKLLHNDKSVRHHDACARCDSADIQTAMHDGSGTMATGARVDDVTAHPRRKARVAAGRQGREAYRGGDSGHD